MCDFIYSPFHWIGSSVNSQVYEEKTLTCATNNEYAHVTITISIHRVHDEVIIVWPQH